MNSEAQQLDLLSQAVDWRLLSLLFECPSAEWRKQVADLCPSTRDDRLRHAAECALAEASEGLYHSIFGPGGPAPAREASYHDTVELGSLMSGLNCYYGAFAYQPLTHEPLDHVSVELGFIAYLLLKQAYALVDGNVEHSAVTVDAQASFKQDHLSVFAEPLAARLQDSGVEYLALASAITAQRVGPPQRGVSRVGWDSAPIACESQFPCGEDPLP